MIRWRGGWNRGTLRGSGTWSGMSTWQGSVNPFTISFPRRVQGLAKDLLAEGVLPFGAQLDTGKTRWLQCLQGLGAEKAEGSTVFRVNGMWARPPTRLGGGAGSTMSSVGLSCSTFHSFHSSAGLRGLKDSVSLLRMV